MNNIYTAEQVKRFETNSFVSKGDDLRAMQEAAKQSVKVLIKDYSKADYLVLCGPGNNGGDGYFIGLGLSESNKCVKFILGFNWCDISTIISFIDDFASWCVA